MAQIELIDSIKKETKIDKGGRATISMRGAARCVGISQQALSKSFKTSDNLTPSELAKKLSEKGFEGDNLATAIPDLALALIIEYYAFEAGRYCTEQALILYRTFAAIGLRTYLQEQVGWEKEVVTQAVPVATKTKALPCAEITLRSRIVRAIDNYVLLFRAPHQQVWQAVYKELKYRYHYDVSARLKASSVKRSKLEQIEADGVLEQLRSVVELVLSAEV